MSWWEIFGGRDEEEPDYDVKEWQMLEWNGGWGTDISPFEKEMFSKVVRYSEKSGANNQIVFLAYPDEEKDITSSERPYVYKAIKEEDT